jgi:hypothetical protein
VEGGSQMTFKKSSFFHCLTALFLVLGLVGLNIASPLMTRAIAIDPKDEALDKGAAWIVARQQPGGGFPGSYPAGTTALALSALTAHAKHLDINPLDEEYEYSEEVIAALNFIFAQTIRDVDNKYVHWGTSQIYMLGPALMAITSVETPDEVIDLDGSAVDGMTHLEVVEEVVNFIAEAQVKSGPGVGLWYYGYPTTTGDMSIAGWITLGLSYAKEKFGVTMPQAMLDYLDEGIDIVIWDDDPDHELYGGAGYTSSSTIENSYRGWINIHKVGHLLSMLELVGDPIDSWRVQASLGFIERHFNAPNSGYLGTSFESPRYVNDYIDVGWRGKDGVTDPSYNGALTIMKGLLAYGIDTIVVDEVETDWQNVFEEVIVDNQHPDGYWQSGGYPNSTSETYRIYYTAWAMMTLLRSVPTIAVTGVDLTCPETSLMVGGDSITLTPTLKPADASNPVVSWYSSNPAIATVVAGEVTPLQAGTTTVRVTTEDGGFTAQCVITVKEPFEFVAKVIEDKTSIGVKATNLNKAVVFTKEELNEDVSVKLVVEVLELEDVDEDDRALIEAFANATIEGDQRNIFYLDISLFKVVGQEETKLTDSLEPITISFVLHEALRDVDFKLLRVHDGVVESLDFDYNEETFEITFETDKFSTYAFAYGVDLQIPDTSDTTHAGGWLLLLGLVLVFFSREKKSNII